MPSFYDIDAANARLPELRETLLALRSMRNDLIALRDRVLALHSGHGELAPETIGGQDPGSVNEGVAVEQETQRLQLRMQGIVDQMQAAVTQIDDWSIQLRDIDRGLVDFPALVNGRPVWLCWRLGEDEIAWWHELSTGFGGRQRLEDLY